MNFYPQGMINPCEGGKRYRPYLVKGKRVEFESEVTLRFTL